MLGTAWISDRHGVLIAAGRELSVTGRCLLAADANVIRFFYERPDYSSSNSIVDGNATSEDHRAIELRLSVCLQVLQSVLYFAKKFQKVIALRFGKAVEQPGDLLLMWT